MDKNIFRRNFLHKSAFATVSALVAGPPLLANIPDPQDKKKKVSTNDKLNIVGVGIGERGGGVISQLVSVGSLFYAIF